MDVSQLDNDIWQSGSVFIGLSVIGLTLLIQAQAKSWGDFVVHMMLSIFGLTLLGIWNKLTAGWLRLVEVNLYRMRAIETEVGMQRERLIAWIDGTHGVRIYDETDELSELKRKLSGSQLGGPPRVRRILKWLVRLIAGGWIILLAKQLIYLLIS